jgi:hypothetical protein
LLQFSESLALHGKDIHLMAEFEYLTGRISKLSEQRKSLESELHANTEAMDLLDGCVSKVRDAIEACSAELLVGAPEQLSDHVQHVIAALLPESASVLLVNRLQALLHETVARDETENKLDENFTLPDCLKHFNLTKVDSMIVDISKEFTIGM